MIHYQTLISIFPTSSFGNFQLWKQQDIQADTPVNKFNEEEKERDARKLSTFNILAFPFFSSSCTPGVLSQEALKPLESIAKIRAWALATGGVV